MSRSNFRLPSLLANRYVRYVTGFGVAVGIGLAPFLGKYKVPLFEPLLNLFPPDSRSTLIPLSAFLMGLIAVAIQFYASETIERPAIRRRFTFGFAAILLAFVGLATIYTPQRVLRLRDPSTGRDEPVILGWSRSESCPCEAESDEDCYYSLESPDDCWPSASQVQLTLHLLYLTLTGGFGGLIGLLLLQEEARQQEKKKQAQKQASKKPAPKRRRRSPKPAAPPVPEKPAQAPPPKTDPQT